MDAEDLDIGIERFNVNGNTGKQSAPSDGNKNCIDIAVSVLGLTNNCHTHNALTYNDVRVIERRHRCQTFFSLKLFCISGGVAEGLTEEDDFAAQSADCVDFEGRRRNRHHDDSTAAEFAGGQGNALSVVSGACSNHAAGAFFRREVCHLAMGAYQLVTDDDLEVSAL